MVHCLDGIEALGAAIRYLSGKVVDEVKCEATHEIPARQTKAKASVHLYYATPPTQVVFKIEKRELEPKWQWHFGQPPY